MADATITLSTAEERRRTVVDAAITTFARTGYQATPVTAIAEEAGISSAYVFKLYAGKEALFLAALGRAFGRVVDALRIGADASTSKDPLVVLDAMGEAYARLIGERSLLMIQVHAMSAADVPAIAAGLRAGIERVTAFAQERSGASAADVQRFIAYGQLCHLIVAIGMTADDGPWAAALTQGIRHF